MEQFTTVCTTVKVLVSAEALHIERACNILKMLNNHSSLIESLDKKAVHRSEFLLTLAQVVDKSEEPVQDLHNSQVNWVLIAMRVSSS